MIFKAISGLLAMLFRRVCRASKPIRQTPAGFSDTEMLDWMDRQTGQGGCVAFRQWHHRGDKDYYDWGWWLKEVPNVRDGEYVPPPRSVRQAIRDLDFDDIRFGDGKAEVKTDTQLIDRLGERTEALWCPPERGHGWRLQLALDRNAAIQWAEEELRVKVTVRDAIADAMRKDARP